MSLLSEAKNNWRITLLVILMVISLFVLFAPLEGLQPGEEDLAGDDIAEEDAIEQEVTERGITNLQWGLELSGGTSVRAPLIGYIVDELDIDPGDEADIAAAFTNELGVSSAEVTVRPSETEGESEGSIEVTDTNVTEDEFVSALDAIGIEYDADTVRQGVHQETLDQTAEILDNKVNTAGLSGATVSTTTNPAGESFVIVEVPNIDQNTLLGLIGERGQVEVVAHFPEETDDGTVYRNETVLLQEHFAQIDPAEAGSGDQGPHVPVRVSSDYAGTFASDMQSYGFAEQGGTTCNWGDPGDRPDDPGHCLLTVVDGEVIYAAGVQSGLAENFRTSDFEQNPRFDMHTTEFSTAQSLAIDLRAGALPAELDFDRGTLFFLEPSLAEDFRYFSVIVGIFAALAVAGMVYWRYRDTRVAAPMLLTASAEVIILLALAVIIPIPLDLAHIAGFIAVLGTGVDDLIIIADEIMQRGDIQTDRVFESRFRKAFWVIGVAAATTILAMTPLVALSLGDLTGFAIVTIIGVLIGVLITRPAYGNILRVLMLD